MESLPLIRAFGAERWCIGGLGVKSKLVANNRVSSTSKGSYWYYCVVVSLLVGGLKTLFTK
jgi:hypothetical protein